MFDNVLSLIGKWGLGNIGTSGAPTAQGASRARELLYTLQNGYSIADL